MQEQSLDYERQLTILRAALTESVGMNTMLTLHLNMFSYHLCILYYSEKNRQLQSLNEEAYTLLMLQSASASASAVPFKSLNITLTEK